MIANFNPKCALELQQKMRVTEYMCVGVEARIGVRLLHQSYSSSSSSSSSKGLAPRYRSDATQSLGDLRRKSRSPARQKIGLGPYQLVARTRRSNRGRGRRRVRVRFDPRTRANQPPSAVKIFPPSGLPRPVVGSQPGPALKAPLFPETISWNADGFWYSAAFTNPALDLPFCTNA